jgi:hypothetical protein
MSLPNKLFQQPKPDDPDRAEDLFDEIQAVLRKRGAALLWHETGMTLCLPQDLARSSWRAIGQAHSITPTEIQWRPIGLGPLKVKQ